MKRWTHIVLAAMIAVGPAPGFGQTGAPRAHRWRVDWGNEYCTLVRLPDETTPFSVGFRVVPGTDWPSIVLTRGGRDPAPEGVTDIVLAPANRSFHVTAAIEDRQRGGSVIVLGGLEGDFWEALRGADALQLMTGSWMRRQIALPRTDAAVAAERQCLSRVMRDWGLDEAALAALRERPVTTNMFGLESTDYPAGAAWNSRQGRVIVRIAVSVEGRATECAVVASSSSILLDEATCRVVLERARFRPAIGADGQPTAARIVGAVLWRMPH